jgi:uncharacterized repeat protein (TIGR03803 family)
LKKSVICRASCLFVFILALSIASEGQTFSALYDLGAGSDPTNPQSPGIVAQGRDGNLYSTAPAGGAFGDGAIFSMTPGGTITDLHDFSGSDGLAPFSGLTLGINGDFYGSTYSGGKSSAGTLFRVTSTGGLKILHEFTGGADGGHPYAPPIQGTDGNLYGTTNNGGAGYGTVYSITPTGTLTTLHTFADTDGSGPQGPLIQATDGNFYGTTTRGGAHSHGTVFKITSGSQFTLLHSFDNADGSDPAAGLVEGFDGNFYGTTLLGGTKDEGVVYVITPAGALTLLHIFLGNTDGSYPSAGVVEGQDGNFYGVTWQGGTNNNGVIFRVDAERTYKVLQDFYGTKSANPLATLLQHTNGMFYGDTSFGGTYGLGVFFSYDVSLAPFAAFIPCNSGTTESSIGLLGQGFTGTTGVSFNGVPAHFTIVSDTYLTAFVPKLATTGPVSITTPDGVLTSKESFVVLP